MIKDIGHGSNLNDVNGSHFKCRAEDGIVVILHSVKLVRPMLGMVASEVLKVRQGNGSPLVLGHLIWKWYAKLKLKWVLLKANCLYQNELIKVALQVINIIWVVVQRHYIVEECLAVRYYQVGMLEAKNWSHFQKRSMIVVRVWLVDEIRWNAWHIWCGKRGMLVEGVQNCVVSFWDDEFLSFCFHPCW